MIRPKRTGLALATAVALLAAAAVVLVPGGSAAQEARSSDQAAPEAQAAEPEFRPGIPGLKMADVRDHKHLWREIEELQQWERTDRISIAEYRNKVIEKTAHFLGFDGAGHDFAKVAAEAVATLRESFLQGRSANSKVVAANPSATWSSHGAYFPEGSGPGATAAGDAQFQSDMGGAVARVSSLLKNEPRHQLFAPECKKWLLKLALGPGEAKEAKQAQARKPDRPR